MNPCLGPSPATSAHANPARHPHPCAHTATLHKSPVLAGALAFLHLTPLHFSTSIISFLFEQAFPLAQNADVGGCSGAEPAEVGTRIYFVQCRILLLFSFLVSLGQLYQSEKSLTVQNDIPASIQPAPRKFGAVSALCSPDNRNAGL